MKYLGKYEGSNYYIKPDEPDYEGIFNPLDGDNIWTLVSFGRLPLDKQVNDLDGFQSFIESRLGRYLPDGALEKILDTCQAAGVPEDEFFNKLAARLDREGVIIKPVSFYSHGITLLSTGVACGWDSGVEGIAVVFKKDLREMWMRKRVSPAIKRRTCHDLDVELNHINDDNTGNMLSISKDPDTHAADSLGGIYGSDYEAATDKLFFAADYF